MKFFLPLLILVSSFQVYSAETCSRIAKINYQQVLVDAGSDKRGEGLRFYLEKDPISKELLDEYQEKNKPTLLSKSASTAGSILLFTGLIQTNKKSGVQNQNTLLYSGALLIGLSYLMTKTFLYNNEKLLKEAVDQYNKRNRPKIFFSPYSEDGRSTGIGIGIQRGF